MHGQSSPKIRNIDEESVSRLKNELSKQQAKYKYDPETEKVVRIEKELRNNEDLKRVTFETETF